MKTSLDWKMEKILLERAAEEGEQIARIAGQKVAPVNPLLIAASEKDQLSLIPGNFKSAFDGQLEFHPKKKRFLLFYNTKYDQGMPPGEHHPRTRFSLGHELGHFYLDRHNSYLRRTRKKHGSRSEYSNNTLMEREADAFSSGLLMPRFLMEEEVNQGELSLDRLDELAQMFKTSLVSTALRAVALSDFACAVVGIRGGAIAWVSRSDSLVKNRFYPPSRGSFTSPTAKTRWQGFVSGRASRHQSPAYARHWFKTFENTELESVSVTEHYLPVPVMDTLIVLLTIPEDELSRIDDD